MKSVVTSTAAAKKTILFVVVFLIACSGSQQATPPVASTQAIFQTEVARFPRLCPDNTPYFHEETESFSPDGLWLGELCLSREYGDLVLTFSNRETGVVWRLFYHDYIPHIEGADGGMRVAHWSKDSRYAYFHTWISNSAGECFYEGWDTGTGLFRLDLQTGETKAILPPGNDGSTWYGFSFAPSGSGLVHGIRTLDLEILDIPTGQAMNVVHQKDFSQGGGYVWSPDGLQFVYSTVKYPPNHVGRGSYTLRLVDIQTGAERILLESKTSCYLAKRWEGNKILLIDYREDGSQVAMKYDLISNAVGP